MKPKMIDDFNETLIESAYKSCPQEINIQEKNFEDEERQIIHEQEEGSSGKSRSKISVSVSSLKKGKGSQIHLSLYPIELVD